MFETLPAHQIIMINFSRLSLPFSLYKTLHLDFHCCISIAMKTFSRKNQSWIFRTKSCIARPFTIFKSHVIVRLFKKRKDLLSCLPTELVLDICVFLDPVDLKCFSISNRRMHELHQRYHRRFRTFTLTGDAKLSFLLRLERLYTEIRCLLQM